MTSSGDEFAIHDQPLQQITRAGSTVISGPPTKRKVGPRSANSARKKPSTMEAIPVSSGDEDIRPSKRGRVATGPGSGTNGRSVSSKGKGKVSTGASARRRKADVEEEGTGMEETAGETDAEARVSRVAKSIADDGKGRTHERLHSQLEHLQKELDSVVQQRDRMSSQLEEVFRLRENGTELQREQKAQYEARLKAQDDTILELQASLSRVDALSQSGGSTSLHFLTRETADEEKQDVQREVSKLRNVIREKDKVIDGKETQIKDLDDTIRVLRADLRAEIENSKALASRNPPSSNSKYPSKSGDPRHALVIRLYEELTGILVTNVKHQTGQYKKDDEVYTCVQTTSKNRSLNFTLKFCQEPEEGESPTSAKQSGRLVDKVIYTPQLLEQETPEFIAQLEFLAGAFTFSKDQMNVFTKTLTERLEGEDEDNQSDTSAIEVELS